MASSQVGDDDKINRRKLAESMLLDLHDHIDYVPLCIHVYHLQRLPSRRICLCSNCKISLRSSQTTSTKARPQPFLLANLEVLINTVLLNASAALHFMDRGSCACFLTAGSRDQHREQDCPCARQQAYLYANERYAYRRHSHTLS
jgi:hypothetical protein